MDTTYPRIFPRLGDDAIGRTVRMVELSLKQSNPDKAKAAIDRLFAGEEVQVTASSPIATLGLPLRTTNALEAMGVLTPIALSGLSVDELMLKPNFGPKTIRSIQRALKPLGLSLRNYA